MFRLRTATYACTHSVFVQFPTSALSESGYTGMISADILAPL